MSSAAQGHRPSAVWRMSFEVYVEAENQEAAETIRNRIGDRIEGQSGVVGCEDSPVWRTER